LGWGCGKLEARENCGKGIGVYVMGKSWYGLGAARKKRNGKISEASKASLKDRTLSKMELRWSFHSEDYTENG
jgi:hypothetical protein